MTEPLTDDEARHIIGLLNQIANHDWRISFLAHTSDTAHEAAQAIARLLSSREADRKEIERLRKQVEDFDAQHNAIVSIAESQLSTARLSERARCAKEIRATADGTIRRIFATVPEAEQYITLEAFALGMDQLITNIHSLPDIARAIEASDD